MDIIEEEVVDLEMLKEFMLTFFKAWTPSANDADIKVLAEKQWAKNLEIAKTATEEQLTAIFDRFGDSLDEYERENDVENVDKISHYPFAYCQLMQKEMVDQGKASVFARMLTIETTTVFEMDPAEFIEE